MGTLGEGEADPRRHRRREGESGEAGLLDGMKIDQKGNIFATAVNGLYVFSPDYTLLGRILTNDKTANCGWGNDGSYLYLCTNVTSSPVWKTTTKGPGF